MYKEKCDPLVCKSYRAIKTIKLLEKPMKVLERVLGKQDQVSIDNMQFGFGMVKTHCNYDKQG